MRGRDLVWVRFNNRLPAPTDETGHAVGLLPVEAGGSQPAATRMLSVQAILHARAARRGGRSLEEVVQVRAGVFVPGLQVTILDEGEEWPARFQWAAP